MKWLLFSDPQFDEQWSYARPGDRGQSSRLLDQIKCLEWSFQVSIKEGCVGHITLGDVFDSRTELSLPVIDAVCSAYQRGLALARKKNPDFKLVFLVGNHDAYLRNASVTSLRMFDGYATVVSKPQVVDQFALVPWNDNRSEYVAALSAATKTADAKFLMSHGIIKGAVPDPEIGFDVDLFAPHLWKGVWMGDVHGPIDGIGGKKNVHYVGAPMQHHFGDAGGDRGVVVLNTKTGSHERILNPVSPKFHILRSIEECVDWSERAGWDGVQHDYVRIDIPTDAALATEWRNKLLEQCHWVESTAVSDAESVAPRLDMKAAVSDRDVLEKYCSFKGVGAEHIDVGLSLLKEAGL